MINKKEYISFAPPNQDENEKNQQKLDKMPEEQPSCLEQGAVRTKMADKTAGRLAGCLRVNRSGANCSEPAV
ncbi:hypothetical protein KDJ56_00315 [Brevibacillus composti]|uniref:Uncharacterized protein n=1 Tax=Brevibacillus composti TaxID=2796470 RepID=A0A7T5EKZ0_9BACL|nr:hypothetical protein [Brevibacillus composti]QQE74513.1 hypothetical protein JD108_00315 [Brevibacillus composti]QUO41595.1 hypothetical protein KDJ56_00315 [Brevibacillus composti]